MLKIPSYCVRKYINYVQMYFSTFMSLTTNCVDVQLVSPSRSDVSWRLFLFTFFCSFVLLKSCIPYMCSPTKWFHLISSIIDMWLNTSSLHVNIFNSPIFIHSLLTNTLWHDSQVLPFFLFMQCEASHWKRRLPMFVHFLSVRLRPSRAR